VVRGPTTPFSPERTQERYVVTSTPGVPEIESQLADDSLVELITIAPGTDIRNRGFETSVQCITMLHGDSALKVYVKRHSTLIYGQ